jgi:hypothetical protein
MNLLGIIKELRSELDTVNQAIAGLELLTDPRPSRTRQPKVIKEVTDTPKRVSKGQ